MSDGRHVRIEGAEPDIRMPGFLRPHLNKYQRKQAARQWSKERFQKFKELQNDGAGLFVDRQLRRFCAEYNNRLAQVGPDQMPASLGLFGRFLMFDKKHRLMRPFPERDHLFAFADFLDYATSTDAPSDPLTMGAHLNEKTIFSYTCLDDPHDLTFSTDAEHEYGVAGGTMIRYGNDLHVVLMAGRLLHEGESVHPLAVDEYVAAQNPSIKPAFELGANDALVEGHSDLVNVIVGAVFDLKNATMQRRYHLEDIGNGYRVATDDPDVLGSVDEAMIRQMEDSLHRDETLFELCKTLLLLPSYFAFKLTLVRDEPAPNSPTSRAAQQHVGRSQKRRRRVDPNSRVVYRRVSALRIVSTSSRTMLRRFSPPSFRVEVQGFWRILKEGAIGKDANGRPTVGRTWVIPHERWRDRPPRPHEILVKSRVSLARLLVASEQEGLRATELSPLDENARPDRQFPTQVSREQMYAERRKLTTKLRWRILQRDNFRCLKCGADAATSGDVRLDVDHIVPVSGGGKTVPENLRTLCSRCNNGKGILFALPPDSCQRA